MKIEWKIEIFLWKEENFSKTNFEQIQKFDAG